MGGRVDLYGHIYSKYSVVMCEAWALVQRL